MTANQNAIDVRISLYTDYLRKVYERFPDVRIDPTPEPFEWRVWLESIPKILGLVSISWIEGRINNLDQARTELCRQIDSLLRQNDIIP